MNGKAVTEEVIDFVRVLEDEMEKFNSFIVEKEEDFVIKWKVGTLYFLFSFCDFCGFFFCRLGYKVI